MKDATHSVLRDAHAIDILALGFLITCPSSRTTRLHAIVCRSPSFGFSTLGALRRFSTLALPPLSAAVALDFFLAGASSSSSMLRSAARVWL